MDCVKRLSSGKDLKSLLWLMNIRLFDDLKLGFFYSFQHPSYTGRYQLQKINITSKLLTFLTESKTLSFSVHFDQAKKMGIFETIEVPQTQVLDE